MRVKVDLSAFENSWYWPGKGRFLRALWFVTNVILVRNPLVPCSLMKVWLLRAFGGLIGDRVTIKPGVNVKYPWLLRVGTNSWIGENAWIDSLALVDIRANVCVSQGAYIGTGNHNWSDRAFALIVKPVILEDGAWIGAHAAVGPGVTVGSHAIVTMGAVLTTDARPYGIYSGNPAVLVKDRVISQ